jgi:hypothetical protein
MSPKAKIPGAVIIIARQGRIAYADRVGGHHDVGRPTSAGP